jgi:DnaJ-class molecular chaperone
MLCVGQRERCFACGGWGNPELERTEARSDAARPCPVCRGLGRTRVVELEDER